MSENTTTFSPVTITDIHWWVPGQLWTITTTKPEGFQYLPGQFARLGMITEGDTPNLWRAYSMVNLPSSDCLQFYAIVVPEGEFSPRLADLKVGDTLYVDHTVFGYLTLERFPSGGKTLWLLCTGTGLSAFMGIINDPLTWERFENVVLVHGVRQLQDLTYTSEIDIVKVLRGERFKYVPAPTREVLAGAPNERIPALLEKGALKEYTDLDLDPATDCVMLCGNPAMLADARAYLQENGFKAERRGVPGNLAVEKYW